MQTNHPFLFIVANGAYDYGTQYDIPPVISVLFKQPATNCRNYDKWNGKYQVCLKPGTLKNGQDLHYHVKKAVKEDDL